MATALVTQIAYAVQTLFDPAGTAGRLVDLGKLANYGLLTSFTPAYLFTSGVNGAWYDPSDITTLYRDAAGTLPVTAVEQPVGLMLDKSKGLVLGPELVTNGGFDTDISGWTGIGAASATWDSGSLKNTVTAGSGGRYQDKAVVAGKTYLVTGTFTISSIATGSATMSTWDGAGFTSLLYEAVKTSAGTYSISFSVRPTQSTMRIYLFVGASAGTTTANFDNISVRELPGNHAFNSSGNSANFPVLKEDATGRRYLSFNGTNQWLQTNSIDFTYGDKMFVSAGVRKLSDAATGIVAELSADWNSNSGSFVFTYPRSAVLNEPLFGSRATSSSLAASGVNTYPAPITNILSGIGNISGDQSILRVNGTQAAISITDQGTGNYGSYPMFVGARAGTSLWFNGRLYQLVVIGKQASSGEIASTEAFVATKTGVTL